MIILYFIPSLDQKTGGTAFFLQTLANEIAKTNEVYIITKKTDAQVEMKNVNIINLDIRLSKLPSFFLKLNQSVKRINPDIIHINVIWMLQSFIMHLVAKINNKKVVLSPHGMLEPWIMKRNKWKKKIALFLYQRYSIRTADFIHVTSKQESDNLKEFKLNSNIEMIPNAVTISNNELKSSWKISNKLLFLSRIHVKKGIELFIETVRQLGDDFKDIEIIVAGDGEPHYIESLKKTISDYKLENKFKFIGGIYGVDKWNLIRSVDVMVLPTFSENFGIVIAEALACGTPVITTKGTPWESIQTHNCGWWIDIDVESLSLALKDYKMKTEEDLKIMGINGNGLIKESFNAESIAKKMNNLYKKIKNENN